MAVNFLFSFLHERSQVKSAGLFACQLMEPKFKPIPVSVAYVNIEAYSPGQDAGPWQATSHLYSWSRETSRVLAQGHRETESDSAVIRTQNLLIRTPALCYYSTT
jgi:hypothetical protein